VKHFDLALVSVSEVWEQRERLVHALVPTEREIFENLGVDKRQREWLAGRMAAKRAVQKRLGLPFARIEIRVDENGRPQLILGKAIELHLSITHSYDVAAAIVARDPIGLDLERIEPRDASFEALVLTEQDRTVLGDLTGEARDERLTMLWCEKEAYAKLEGSGLRIPFAELVVPEQLRVERGTVVLRGTSFAFAIVVASPEWPITTALAAKDR
jgi:4'-phosphopantetheinyl transferase